MLECFATQTDLESQTDLKSHVKIKIPSDWGDWLGDSFRGRVAFVRNFGLPTGLAENQKVWLVVEEVDFRGNVFLNRRPLGPIQLGEPPMRIEIHSQLGKSNELRIEIEVPVQADRGHRDGLAGGLTGGVRLEIEEPD